MADANQVAGEAEDEFYTVDEVASKLKVHKTTVLARIKAGELTACWFGDNLIRVRKSDFEAYVDLSRGTPRAEG